MFRVVCTALLMTACGIMHAASTTEADFSGVTSRANIELDLIGTSSVQYNDFSDNTARIKIVEVRNNRPSGVSGTLSIQLWAFFAPFTGEGGEIGYELGEVVLGTLPAGSSFRNVDQIVPGMVIPPDGIYYGSFLLVENNGEQDYFFDYVNFSGSVVYTDSEADVVAPPQFNVKSFSSTAKQNTPFSYTFPGSSGALPKTHTVSGLPIGMELNNSSIDIDGSGVIFPLISGTPKNPGTFVVTLRAINDDGTDTFTFTLTVEEGSLNVPPTINSLTATPNPAIPGQVISFSAMAADPENVEPEFLWDFKDGTTLPGAAVSHTFSTAGTYSVTVTVSDGVNTVLQSVNVEVTGASTNDPYINSVNASANPVMINTPVSFTANAFSPVNEALTFTWNFGDGTPTTAGNIVSHSYTSKGEYTISMTVQDLSGRLGYFSDLTMFVIDSSDSANIVLGEPSISPDGVQITVAPSPPGVLALELVLADSRNAVNRANFDFSTDFLIPGRAATRVGGHTPISRMNRPSVVVVTSTAVDMTGTSKTSRGRKTIPIGAKDIGEIPAVPDTLSDAQKVVIARKVVGSFSFSSDKADKFSASFTIPLPTGYDLLRSQELSIGVGNVADRIILNAVGKATGLADRGILQKVRIKYPRGANGHSVAGETALIDVTFVAPNLDQAGFESDGITPGVDGVRTLQVAIVLAGIPYSGSIPVDFKVSSKGDRGGLKLRR